jgi:peptidoglycan hydrolase-like protein with peptidoglycan-binding domain
LASTGAHKRSRFVRATAIVASLLALATYAPTAEAAGAGGASAPSATSTAKAGGTSTTKAPSSSTGRTGAGASAAAKPSRHVMSVKIQSVSCVPAARCSANPHQVSIHGTLLLGGVGLRPGMVVAFPKAPGARISSVSPRTQPAAHTRYAIAGKPGDGLLVTVPKTAHSGHIMILLSGGRYTSSYGPIYVYNHALHPPPPPTKAVPAPTGSVAVADSPFEGQGMWIWYLSKSDGGNIAAIAAQAHAAGVSTLFIKSSDGSSNYWSQFSPQLVAELHANGLKVCAWQFVYGTEPVGEAALGAEAVADGADCLVIDAEGEYEGHYAAAQTYIDDLRAKVGPTYPLGLASFPYVSYHPSFPYSVFLGPGGAQYNAPQMYWKDIGQSVDTVYANTYIANRIYGRPMYPLGQTYGRVSSAELLRFREEAVDYGATGISFWDWQETGVSGWTTLASPLAPLTSVTPNSEVPELHDGSKGDQVLWMQEHLASAVPTQETTGVFGAQTLANLEAFQTAHAIAASGIVEAATWAALLALAPVPVAWTGSSKPSD